MKKNFGKQLLTLLLAIALVCTIFPTSTIAASKVKLNKTKATIYVGGSVTLKLTGTKKTVKWSSGKKSVATVSKKGVVTGKKKGSTDITATAGGKRYTCRITVKKIEKTSVQSQKTRYTAVDKVGTYNKKIITDKLLSSCTLGEVDKANLPYWNGVVSETKLSANNAGMPNWDKYTPGFTYFSEEELACLAKNGFNCYRVMYSLSWLSNPKNTKEINVAELEQLDEVISWCAKYNIHCMISISGLPGMKGKPEKENCQSNPAVFTDSSMEALYSQYMKMLSRRYAALPSGLLSFELLAEPEPSFNADGVDIDHYCEVLGKVADSIWEDNAKRIVIAMETGGVFPEELAKRGCCISKHSHVYAVDGSRLKEYGINGYEPTWPMQYLPSAARNGLMRLRSENGFSAGTYTLFVCNTYGNSQPRITCDGTDAQVKEGSTGKGATTYSVTVPAGTKEIAWIMPEDGGFQLLMLKLRQNGKKEIQIASHSMYGCGEYDGDAWPTIEVKADGTLQNQSSQTLDSDQLYDSFYREGDELAKKYGVSYIVTEVGTDTDALSVKEYLAYHEALLKALKKHNIGWTYNCAHNILGPKDSIWLNGVNNKIPFKNFDEWKSTPYYYNKDVLNLLKKYQ
ncbi:MAG: Ig-like domain-containing protein [Muribaculaceae bacterium]|nr:Ig-like domain-containing protein [Roseburia sp.]MCM1432000.1 Ig-like domain-containing protein [Muribaculaceae bacterium]MCM1493746.1 Ig-like domain-containing protein [Muribaculaceae bacterium]